jgi:hypothetical protein
MVLILFCWFKFRKLVLMQVVNPFQTTGHQHTSRQHGDVGPNVPACTSSRAKHINQYVCFTCIFLFSCTDTYDVTKALAIFAMKCSFLLFHLCPLMRVFSVLS